MISMYKDLEKRIIWTPYFLSSGTISRTVPFFFPLLPVTAYTVSHMVKMSATINKLV